MTTIAEMTDEEFATHLADAIVRIEANYCREGSGPGSRFEGQRLEDVQVRFILREVGARGTTVTPAQRG